MAGQPRPVSRIDDLSDLSWERELPPVTPPFDVRWRGLVYVTEDMSASLQAPTVSYATVLLDGQEVYRRNPGQAAAHSPIPLVPGWHVVDINARQLDPGGVLRLVWATNDGAELAIESQDLFPLRELRGWVQTRTVGLPGGLDAQTTQRFDLAPHYVSAATIALLAQHDGFEPQLTEERWHGVWHIDEGGEYTIGIEFRSGQTTLLIDGQSVAQSQEFNQSNETIEGTVTLTAGPHRVEIVQSRSTAVDWAGATISAIRAGQPVEMRVTPY